MEEVLSRPTTSPLLLSMPKSAFRYKPDTYVGITYTERLKSPVIQQVTKVPSLLEVTKFMPSTAKRKRKSMFNSTPKVKGLYVSVN